MQGLRIECKSGIFFILFLLVVIFLVISLTAWAYDWQKLNGDHFFIYYIRNKNSAKDILGAAEVYYKRIAKDLGYPRYSEFWLWDERAKIYIYPDRQSFLKATGQPKWSEGMADYQKREIVSYAWSEGFIESLLPHEIAHLIFRDFVGFSGEIPLWLDEGVAQWAETEKRSYMKELAKESYRQSKMLLVEDLMKLDINRLKDINKVYIRPTLTRKGSPGILFLTPDSLVNAYYLAAVSLIGFLIERYGSQRFAEFCRSLRDGKSVEVGLRFAYPGRVKNLQDLELKWREYLEEQM
ncbi:MAG: hypothetical protein NG737_06095 [Omnitrophica bacterium]|nr:hypothetical protein [Candidatus Omnitrophota bacterium]